MTQEKNFYEITWSYEVHKLCEKFNRLKTKYKNLFLFLDKLVKDKELIGRIIKNTDVAEYIFRIGKMQNFDEYYNLSESDFNECINQYKSSTLNSKKNDPINESDLNGLNFASYQELCKCEKNIRTNDIPELVSRSKKDIEQSGLSQDKIQEIIKCRNDCNKIIMNTSVEIFNRIEKFSDKSLKEKLKNGQINKDASQKIKDSYKNVKTEITELSNSEDSICLCTLLLMNLKAIEILDIAEKNVDKPLMKALVNFEKSSNYTKEALRGQKEDYMNDFNKLCSCILEYKDETESLKKYIGQREADLKKASYDEDIIKNCAQIITRGYILKTENKKIINLFAKFEQNLDVFKAEMSILDEEFSKGTEDVRYDRFKKKLKEFEGTRNKYVENFQTLEKDHKGILDEIQRLKKGDPIDKGSIETQEKKLKDLKFDEGINKIITDLEKLNKDIDNYLYDDKKGPNVARDNFLIRFFKAIWEMISKLWDNPEKELYDKGKDFNLAETEFSRVDEEEKQAKQNGAAL